MEQLEGCWGQSKDKGFPRQRGRERAGVRRRGLGRGKGERRRDEGGTSRRGHGEETGGREMGKRQEERGEMEGREKRTGRRRTKSKDKMRQLSAMKRLLGCCP